MEQLSRHGEAARGTALMSLSLLVPFAWISAICARVSGRGSNDHFCSVPISFRNATTLIVWKGVLI